MLSTKRFAALAATLLPPLAAPAFSSPPPARGTPAASGGGGGAKVAALFPGLVDDQSWNQAGFEGLKRAETGGATIAYTEKVTQDQQVEVFRTYAQQGNNVVIGHGGEYMDAALQVASEFPNVQFVVTNANKSGLVVGETIPIANDAIKGWKDGCARVNPNAVVTASITGDWADTDKAREAALALVAGGADVLGHVLDAADAGVFAAAEDKGVYAIGLYADESSFGPTSHIGAALADASLVVFNAATQPLNGKANSEGVAEGVVSFGAFSDKVPQAVRDAVKAAEDDLKSGKTQF